MHIDNNKNSPYGDNLTYNLKNIKIWIKRSYYIFQFLSPCKNSLAGELLNKLFYRCKVLSPERRITNCDNRLARLAL